MKTRLQQLILFAANAVPLDVEARADISRKLDLCALERSQVEEWFFAARAVVLTLQGRHMAAGMSSAMAHNARETWLEYASADRGVMN